MSHDVIFQGQLFGMAILWGGGLMLAYDGLRLLRLFAVRQKGVQAACELVFWLAASFYIYRLIYRYNSGAVRNYVVFGMAVGMLLYRAALSAQVMRIGCFLLRLVRRVIRFFKTFLKDLGKLLQSGLAKVTIKLRNIKKQGDGDGGKEKKNVRKKDVKT